MSDLRKLLARSRKLGYLEQGLSSRWCRRRQVAGMESLETGDILATTLRRGSEGCCWSSSKKPEEVGNNSSQSAPQPQFQPETINLTVKVPNTSLDCIGAICFVSRQSVKHKQTSDLLIRGR